MPFLRSSLQHIDDPSLTSGNPGSIPTKDLTTKPIQTHQSSVFPTWSHSLIGGWYHLMLEKSAKNNTTFWIMGKNLLEFQGDETFWLCKLPASTIVFNKSRLEPPFTIAVDPRNLVVLMSHRVSMQHQLLDPWLDRWLADQKLLNHLPMSDVRRCRHVKIATAFCCTIPNKNIQITKLQVLYLHQFYSPQELPECFSGARLQGRPRSPCGNRWKVHWS